VTLAGGVDATGADYAAILAILCGFGAIVGHIWTVWARFKGGKGVGTSAGVFFALAPWCGLAAFLTFAVTLAICRYVSLGSICAAFVLASSAIIQSLTSYPTQLHPATAAIATIVATVVIVMHHGNIRRLLDGTENRFGRPASAAPTDDGEQSG
jgi:acyl phosphate:glycerol-3-phosphate acyltransferase